MFMSTIVYLTYVASIVMIILIVSGIFDQPWYVNICGVIICALLCMMFANIIPTIRQEHNSGNRYWKL